MIPTGEVVLEVDRAVQVAPEGGDRRRSGGRGPRPALRPATRPPGGGPSRCGWTRPTPRRWRRSARSARAKRSRMMNRRPRKASWRARSRSRRMSLVTGRAASSVDPELDLVLPIWIESPSASATSSTGWPFTDEPLRLLEVHEAVGAVLQLQLAVVPAHLGVVHDDVVVGCPARCAITAPPRSKRAPRAPSVCTTRKARAAERPGRATSCPAGRGRWSRCGRLAGSAGWSSGVVDDEAATRTSPRGTAGSDTR